MASHHFISLKDLSIDEINSLFARTDSYFNSANNQIHYKELLNNLTVANLFFEASTRTRCSFELAAHKLGAYVLNLDIAHSATNKGESLFDTFENLMAMEIKIFCLRHQDDNSAAELAKYAGNRAIIINAGAGALAHPSQALLDMYTIKQHKPKFAALKVAIVGDIKHSRVAREQIIALQKLGVKDIRLVGPKALMPADISGNGIRFEAELDAGISNVDVVMLLRIQKERMAATTIPSLDEYYYRYGLNLSRLASANDNAIVLHPGPMNRGVEIADELADSPRCVRLQQVHNGVATRMAILSTCYERFQNL